MRRMDTDWSTGIAFSLNIFWLTEVTDATRVLASSTARCHGLLTSHCNCVAIGV